KNKCRLFYFNILNHKRYYLFLTFIILLNVTLSIIRCTINISNKFHIIQTICILIYLLEFIIKVSLFFVLFNLNLSIRFIHMILKSIFVHGLIIELNLFY